MVQKTYFSCNFCFVHSSGLFLFSSLYHFDVQFTFYSMFLIIGVSAEGVGRYLDVVLYSKKFTAACAPRYFPAKLIGYRKISKRLCLSWSVVECLIRKHIKTNFKLKCVECVNGKSRSSKWQDYCKFDPGNKVAETKKWGKNCGGTNGR